MAATDDTDFFPNNNSNNSDDVNSHRIQQLLHHPPQQQQQQPPLQPPTRIKSFLRQNQYNTGTKIFLPLFYLAVTMIYFHSLLFHNVESSSSLSSSGGSGGGESWQQPRAQLYHGKDETANTNDPNINLAQKEDTVMLLEPRSLAHVAITNAEIAWRRHVDRENYMRRQAERREERAKEWLRKKAQQEKEDEEKERVLLRGGGSLDTTLTKNNQSSNNSTTDTDTEEELEAASNHLKNLVSANKGSLMSALAGVAGAGASKRKLPISAARVGGSRSVNGQINDNNQHHQRASSSTPGFLPLLLVMFTCSMLRVCVQVLVRQEQSVGIGLDSLANDSDDDNDDDNNNNATTRRRRRTRRIRDEEGSGGVLSVATRLRRRAQISHAQRQFQNFANRLNAERAANGERHISVDVLRHLVHARDFNGNDYDRLSNFVEENGPAMGSFFSAIGATDAEINRCPSRVLEANDELLRLRMSTSSSRGRSSSSSGGSSRHGMGDPSLQQQEQQTMHSSSCAVCLEQYQVGETVRTIPCFHTFHATCIDPWLAQRAECPVCKHSAIG